MGKRDDLCSLTAMVEFDEGFFKIAVSPDRRNKLKHGKGSQQMQDVGILAESIPLEDPETGEETKHCRFFKMAVLDSQKADSVNLFIKQNVTSDSVLFSDQCKTYQDIHRYVDLHVTEKSSKETTIKALKWVHIAIGNAKRTFLGVYHQFSSDYLQSYLNEFNYKLNRRFSRDLFERVIIAAVFPYWYNCV